MDIIISNSAAKPIYEQIATQIKELIASGTLSEGEALPSMRLLARELRISLITTKRAYEELEREGFIVSVPGKGSFVLAKDIELVRERRQKETTENVIACIESAKLAGMDRGELLELVRQLF